MSHTTRWVAKAIRVRLRFVLVIAVAAVVLGGWDTWRTYWDRWIIGAKPDPSLGAVSTDTEYFCPMDPGVLSGWSGKCPVCNMALVRRAKGDMTPLPTGVVARVGLSTSRIQMGGIRVESVGFTALNRILTLVGKVEERDGRTVVVASTEGVDRSGLRDGDKVQVTTDPPDGRGPFASSVLRLESESILIAPDDPNLPISPGRFVRASIAIPVTDLEPFRSSPDEIPPRMSGEPRSIYVCDEHPSVVRVEKGSCPEDGNALMERASAKDQRVRWWCPMHPKVTSENAGAKCEECGGMTLIPRIVTFRPKGKVMAVPESAVIDTGNRQVVYVESMPGTFDGVEVTLGPRCGAMYPVVSGLEAGQKVVISGAFLIDAETRLNPGLAAAYFGASRSGEPVVEAPKPKLDFSKLNAADRVLAIAQKTCPVTKKPLGSMGTPIKLTVAGKSVFVCCDGCIETLQSKPEKYMKPAPSPTHHP